MKAMRRRIALQSTSCEMGRAGSPLHAAALVPNGAHRSDAPYRAIDCFRSAHSLAAACGCPRVSASRTDSSRGELVTPKAFAGHELFLRWGSERNVLARAPKPAPEAGALPDPKPRCALSFAGSRKTTTRISREGATRLLGNPEKSVVSLSSAQEPTAQRRAINFRSLRRCVKASPAIASAPPIHVLGSGTAACDHREHDVVAIASGVTDRENGTVAAHHGTPLGDPRKCAGDGAPGDFVQNGKCLPERQCRADCDHKIAIQ